MTGTGGDCFGHGCAIDLNRLAIHEHVAYPSRRISGQPFGICREVAHTPNWSWIDRFRVEDRDVSPVPRS